ALLQEKSRWKILFPPCIQMIAIVFDKRLMTRFTRVKITILNIGWSCQTELCVGWRRAEVCTSMPMATQPDFWESTLILLLENRRNSKPNNAVTSSVT